MLKPSRHPALVGRVAVRVCLLVLLSAALSGGCEADNPAPAQSGPQSDPDGFEADDGDAQMPADATSTDVSDTVRSDDGGGEGEASAHDLADAEPAEPVMFLAWNLWHNDLSEANRDFVAAWQPDVAGFSELEDGAGLTALVDEADFAYSFDASADALGMASHRALSACESLHGDFIRPVLVCEVDLGRPVTVFNVHLTNPTYDPEDYVTQQSEVDELLGLIETRTGHQATIVMGDLNARSVIDGETEYTYATDEITALGYVDTYAQFVAVEDREATKLARSNEGKRIDYVFVSVDLSDRLIDAGVMLDTVYPDNSDHRAVFAILNAESN